MFIHGFQQKPPCGSDVVSLHTGIACIVSSVPCPMKVCRQHRVVAIAVCRPSELPVCIRKHPLGIEQCAEVIAGRGQVRVAFDGAFISIMSFLEPAKKWYDIPRRLKVEADFANFRQTLQFRCGLGVLPFLKQLFTALRVGSRA